MDAKLVFKPARNVELFVVGQNLFSQHYKALGSDFVSSAQTSLFLVEFMLGAQWRF
jgi:iron complex outermembrane receptor protein